MDATDEQDHDVDALDLLPAVGGVAAGRDKPKKNPPRIVAIITSVVAALRDAALETPGCRW